MLIVELSVISVPSASEPAFVLSVVSSVVSSVLSAESSVTASFVMYALVPL